MFINFRRVLLFIKIFFSFSGVDISAYKVSINSLFGSNICLFSLTVEEAFGSIDFPQFVELVEKRSSRSNPPEVFLGKVVLKMCSEFTGELPCRSAISIKLLFFKNLCKIFRKNSMNS